jgi:hypothetical protein
MISSRTWLWTVGFSIRTMCSTRRSRFLGIQSAEERKPETHPPVRDEGEGVRRVDRERRQDRKNSMGEVIV